MTLTPPQSEASSVLVIGLGNPILRDDGVGIVAARRFAELVEGDPRVVVEEDTHGGLRLMERMVGYRHAIVLDAMVTGAEPGSVAVFAPTDFPTAHSASTHDMTLPAALELGREAGVSLPDNDAIALIGIEAADLISFGEELTPPVAAALDEAIRHTKQILDAMLAKRAARADRAEERDDFT